MIEMAHEYYIIDINNMLLKDLPPFDTYTLSEPLSVI